MKKYRIRLPNGVILFKTNSKKELARVREKLAKKKIKHKVEVIY